MIEKVLIGLLGSLFVFFTPTFPLILLVGLFIAADTFFGVYTSWRLGEPIVSRKLARLVSKLVVYTGAILLVYTLDFHVISYFTKPLLATKLAAGVLCFIEGFSIDEKIRKINNNKGIVYYLKKLHIFVKSIKDGYNDVINGK
jgi:small neutral amino acid transporter SnatA (MarC family)